jgi:hypothetical protein
VGPIVDVIERRREREGHRRSWGAELGKAESAGNPGLVGRALRAPAMPPQRPFPAF